MKKNDLREIVLLEELKKRKKMEFSEALELLNVSEATLRRLFAKLEAENKLLRTHGGIRMAQQLLENYSFLLSSQQDTSYKTAIAKAALTEIKNGCRIFLDAGTTALKLAEELCLPLQTGGLKNISVVTTSLALAGNLAQYCEVLLVGGRIRPERSDVCGAVTCQALESHHFNLAFCGADAITADGKLMTTDHDTASCNSIFLKNTERKIILADSSKFDRSSFVGFSDLDSVDIVYTDKRLAKSKLNSFKKFHAKIVCCTP